MIAGEGSFLYFAPGYLLWILRPAPAGTAAEAAMPRKTLAPLGIVASELFSAMRAAGEHGDVVGSSTSTAASTSTTGRTSTASTGTSTAAATGTSATTVA